MADRKRRVGKLIYFTEEELSRVENNMAEAHITNFSLYSRKMLTNGQIVHVNFDEIKKLNVNLAQVGNNMNQLAKLANTEGIHPAGLYQALDEWTEFKSYYTEIMNKLVARMTKNL